MDKFVQTIAIAKGNVQGVGFRYFAKNIANKLDIKGHAMNLHNGDVELLLQGTEEKIKQILSEIKKEFKDNLSSLVILEEKPCKSLSKEFAVRFLNK